MIHVLGFGSIGRLVAHTLRKQGLPVTLLVRDAAVAKFTPEWQLIVEPPTKCSGDTEISSGYLAESSESSMQYKVLVKTLVVCTKAYDSAGAVKKMLARLDPHSTILLLNNGLGVYEQVQETICMQTQLQHVNISEAFLSHGVYKTASNAIRHAGLGAFLLSSANRSATSQEALQGLARYFAPLSAQCIPYKDFQLRQIEKLLVNATINPITAILKCKNGHVLDHIRLVKAIIAESLPILHAKYTWLNLEADDVLESVVDVATKTARNQSSMLQDIQAGKPTEIDFMNGYLVRLAQLLTMPATCNQIITQIIHDTSLGKDTTESWQGLQQHVRVAHD